MTKAQICKQSQTIAVYSMGLVGLELKKISFEDGAYYAYCVYTGYIDKPSYHRLLIKEDWKGNQYILWCRQKVGLREFIRV